LGCLRMINYLTQFKNLMSIWLDFAVQV